MGERQCPLSQKLIIYASLLYMCRLLSICGKTEYKKVLSILKRFQRLAEYGKVPGDSRGGHKDGWGIVAYRKKRPIFLEKSYKDAYCDPKYGKSVSELVKQDPDIIIGHLRKASIGAKSIENVQPFVFKNHSFCQNGTIFRSRDISLSVKYEKVIQGTTDSERLFSYILQFLGDDAKANSLSVRSAIREAVAHIRKNFDFTAMNVVFSDGKAVWALREVNKKNKYVENDKLTDYYSLFLGIGRRFNVISSEKILIKGIKWKALKNHEMVEIIAMDGRIRSSSV